MRCKDVLWSWEILSTLVQQQWLWRQSRVLARPAPFVLMLPLRGAVMEKKGFAGVGGAILPALPVTQPRVVESTAFLMSDDLSHRV